MKWRTVVLLILGLFILSACVDTDVTHPTTEVYSPTPEPSTLPSPASLPPPTLESAPTPDPAPSPTPAPTLYPAPFPTPLPTPASDAIQAPRFQVEIPIIDAHSQICPENLEKIIQLMEKKFITIKIKLEKLYQTIQGK